MAHSNAEDGNKRPWFVSTEISKLKPLPILYKKYTTLILSCQLFDGDYLKKLSKKIVIQTKKMSLTGVKLIFSILLILFVNLQLHATTDSQFS